MSNTPGINVPITGTTTGLNAALNQAGVLIKKFGATVNSASKPARESLDKLGGVIKDYAAPIAAMAGAWYGFSKVAEAFARGGALTKTARDLGITTEALTKLQAAGRASGVTSEDLERSLQRMSTWLAQSAEVGSQASKELAKLGLSAKDFSGMSADEAFKRLGDAMKDSGDAATIARVKNQAFGQEMQDVAMFAMQGSKAINEMEESAKQSGKALTAVDVAALTDGRDGLREIGKIFEELTNSLAVELGPAFKVVAATMREWIGDGKGMKQIFETAAKGIMVAIGGIRMVWDGLVIMWDSGKVAVAALSVAFYEAARGITKAILFIWGEMKNVFGVMKAGWNEVGAVISVVWNGVKFAAVSAFAFVEKNFGKMIAEMGATAEESGLPGLANLGNKAREVGLDLQFAAEKLKQGASKDLKEATDGLKKSSVELVDAVKAFGKMPDVETPWLDRMTQNAHGFLSSTTKDLAEAAQKLADKGPMQQITSMLDKYSKRVKEVQDKATKDVTSGTKKRAIVVYDAFKRENDYLRLAGDRHAEYAFNLWKSEVDAYEKIMDVQRNAGQLNQTLIAQHAAADAEYYATAEARADEYTRSLIRGQSDAEEKIKNIKGNAGLINQKNIADMEVQNEEWYATGLSREAKFHNDIQMQAAASHEELYLEMNKSEADRAALQSSYNDQRLLEEQRIQDEMTMLWESGARGKMQAIGGILENLSVLMESNNKKMFQVGKAAAIASTVISTYEGAQKAYTSMAGIPVVGPALGAAAAGAAVLAGMVRLQKIQSTQFGGGGGGGGGSGGGGYSGASAAADAANSPNGGNRPNQQINITMMGDRFGQNQVRALIGQINSAVTNDNITLKAN
jgi:hypothetical protein